MRFSTKLIMVVMSMMLLASCGTELPDNIKNYEVNKGGDSGGTNNITRIITSPHRHQQEFQQRVITHCRTFN